MTWSPPRITCAQTHGAPAILIGHSLGGAAVLAAAHRIADARAVVTIAAPCDPAHVTGLFKEQVDKIREQGEVEVSLAGRPFRIKREFLDDISEQRINDRVANLRKALLIFHSPTDDTVSIDNASRIFLAAKHPKSFVSLAGADHLLSKKSDAVYVANVIAAWAERYLETPVGAKQRTDRGRHSSCARNRQWKIPAGNFERAAPVSGRRAGQSRRAGLRARVLTISCSPGSAPARR